MQKEEFNKMFHILEKLVLARKLSMRELYTYFNMQAVTSSNGRFPGMSNIHAINGRTNFNKNKLEIWKPYDNNVHNTLLSDYIWNCRNTLRFDINKIKQDIILKI